MRTTTFSHSKEDFPMYSYFEVQFVRFEISSDPLVVLVTPSLTLVSSYECVHSYNVTYFMNPQPEISNSVDFFYYRSSILLTLLESISIYIGILLKYICANYL